MGQGKSQNLQSSGSQISEINSYDLTGKNLKEVPPDLFQLTNLQQLNLSDNSLTIIPDIRKLQNLTFIDMSHNLFSRLDSIFFLKQLKVARINDNYIRELPDTLVNLRELEELNASQNEIPSIPFSVQFLSNLIILNLSNNKLTSIPTEIAQLKKLEQLSLQHNMIKSLPFEISELESLVTLNCTDNNLTRLPTSLGSFKKVTKMYFDHNTLQAIPPSIGQCKTLKELFLNDNDLVDLPETLVELPNLYLLDVNNNSFADARFYESDIDELKKFLLTERKIVDSALRPVKEKKAPDPGKMPSEKMKRLKEKNKTLNTKANTQQESSPKERKFWRFRGNSIVFVDLVDPSSMSEGEVYLLDTNNTIFIWCGSKSLPQQKKKALHIAKIIADTSATNPETVVLEGKLRNAGRAADKFFKFLGDKKTKIPESPQVSDDSTYYRLHYTKLHSFWNDPSGKLRIRVSEENEPLLKTSLESSMAFVVDSPGDIYVWCGLYSDETLKSWAMLKAEELSVVKTPSSSDPSDRPLPRDISWQIDGQEMWHFKELFFDWMDESWCTQNTTKAEQPEVRSEVNEDQFYAMNEVGQRPSKTNRHLPKSYEEDPFSIPEPEPMPPTDFLGKQMEIFDRVVHEMIVEDEENLRLRELRLLEEEEAAKVQSSLQPVVSQKEAPKIPNEVGKSQTAPKTGEVRSRTTIQRTVAPGGTRPQKKPARPTKQKPTSNPIRARQQISEEAEKQSREGGNVNSGGRAATSGGFGLLWSLGVTNQQLGFAEKKTTPKFTEDDFFYKKGVPRLIHIKGRRKTLVRQVQLSSESLNESDVYILDTGKINLYQWNGRKSNRIVRGKALDVVKNIKDKDYGGTKTLKFLDQGKTDDGTNKEFWEILGGKPDFFPAGDSEDINEEIVKNILSLTCLYQVVKTEEGDYIPERVASYPLSKNLLKEDGCYILDCVTESFVWCGKKSNLKARQHTVNLSKGLKEERKVWTALICRELPDAESVLFRERFSDWSYGPPISVAQATTTANVAPTVLNKIDMAAFHKNRLQPLVEVVIDDGKNTPQIWRIEGFERKNIPEKNIGEFFSGESYIVLYKYEWKNKNAGLIYYWQGRNSTTIDQGTAALITRDLNTELQKTGDCAATKDMRVTQNLEPKHFLDIFKQSFMIHKGKEQAEHNIDLARLYEIQEKHSGVRCIEVSCTVRALKSQAVFLLRYEKGNLDYIWKGSVSQESEFQFAKGLASVKRGKEAVVVEEGKEPEWFWKFFPSGKEEYMKIMGTYHIPRLFHYMSTHAIEEVTPFCQDDLNRNDVYILDTYMAVFVWQYQDSWADEKERRIVLELAQEYIEAADDGRKDCVGYYVPGGSGYEPLAFTSAFHAWDPTPLHDHFYSNLTKIDNILKQYNRTFTYQELLEGNYPKALDTSQLECYMDDNQFYEVFEMNRKQFAELPKWKQQQLKREKELY